MQNTFCAKIKTAGSYERGLYETTQKNPRNLGERGLSWGKLSKNLKRYFLVTNNKTASFLRRLHGAEILIVARTILLSKTKSGSFTSAFA